MEDVLAPAMTFKCLSGIQIAENLFIIIRMCSMTVI